MQRRLASEDILRIEPIGQRIPPPAGSAEHPESFRDRDPIQPRPHARLGEKLNRRFATGGAEAKKQHHDCQHNMQPRIGGIV